MPRPQTKTEKVVKLWQHYIDISYVRRQKNPDTDINIASYNYGLDILKTNGTDL